LLDLTVMQEWISTGGADIGSTDDDVINNEDYSLHERELSTKDPFNGRDEFKRSWKNIVDTLHTDSPRKYDASPEIKESRKKRPLSNIVDETFLSESEGFVEEMEQIELLSSDPRTIAKRKNTLDKLNRGSTESRQFQSLIQRGAETRTHRDIIEDEEDRLRQLVLNQISPLHVKQATRFVSSKKRSFNDDEDQAYYSDYQARDNKRYRNIDYRSDNDLKGLSPTLNNNEVDDEVNRRLLTNDSYVNLLTILASPLPTFSAENSHAPNAGTNQRVGTKATPAKKDIRSASHDTRRSNVNPRRSLKQNGDQGSKNHLDPTELRKLISDVYSKKKPLNAHYLKSKKDQSSSNTVAFSLSGMMSEEKRGEKKRTPSKEQDYPESPTTQSYEANAYEESSPPKELSRPSSAQSLSSSASATSSMKRVRFSDNGSEGGDSDIFQQQEIEDDESQQYNPSTAIFRTRSKFDEFERLLASDTPKSDDEEEAEISDHDFDTDRVNATKKNTIKRVRQMVQEKQLVNLKGKGRAVPPAKTVPERLSRQLSKQSIDFNTRTARNTRHERVQPKHPVKPQNTDIVQKFMRNPLEFSPNMNITDLVVGRRSSKYPTVPNVKATARASTARNYETAKYNKPLARNTARPLANARQPTYDEEFMLNDTNVKDTKEKIYSSNTSRDVMEQMEKEELNLFRKLLDENETINKNRANKIGRGTKLDEETKSDDEDDDFFEARRMMHNITLLRSYLGDSY
jgi:hypothetical protein